EAKNEEEAATICYENFGVTFTMLAPTKVKGEKANPVFSWLGGKTQAPGWNFNKYLVSADGTKVTHYGSKVTPTKSKLEEDVKKELKISYKAPFRFPPAYLFRHSLRLNAGVAP